MIEPTSHNVDTLKHFLMLYCLDEEFWNALSDAEKYSSLENQAMQAIQYMNRKLRPGSPHIEQAAHCSDSPWHRIASFLNLHDYTPRNQGLTARALSLLNVLVKELHWNAEDVPLSQNVR
jgi:hypothetical protein